MIERSGAMRDGARRLLVIAGATLASRDGARRLLATAGVALVLTALVAADSTQPAAGAPGAALPAAAVSTATKAGTEHATVPGMSRSVTSGVEVTHQAPASRVPAIAPLTGLLQADLMVVAPGPLSTAVAAAVRKLPGVAAALRIDAARIPVDGKLTGMLGVDPSAFRAFAAQPTAGSTGLWQNVAAGGVAVSYTMGTLDKLPLDRPVRVAGRRTEELRLAGLGTTGIPGVDAVVSDTVARSLGIPAGNAIVISAPHAGLSTLMRQIQALLPPGAAIAPLVAQAQTGGGTVTTQPGVTSLGTAAAGPGLTPAEVITFLKAAESRLGLPYVYGGNGPNVFDCSGLVKWSLAQAGVVMPRVAADQALTGPAVPVSQLQPGDLLFYHTDPTAPGYISHVAIYLGDDVMLQAPQPGEYVETVPADFGSEFAGAIQVYPAVAAAVAARSPD
jgi:peptidoglycan DL-endopeptidase CwlO